MTVPQNAVNYQGQGAVPADALNTFVQTVTNYATLRGFVGVAGMEIELQGGVNQNDGGQGNFVWSPIATGPDNGYSIIVPLGVAVGAWLRLSGTAPRLIPLSGVWTQPGSPPGALQFIDGWDMPVAATWPAAFLGSAIHAEIAPTANYTFSILLNGTVVGTMTITPANTYSFTTVNPQGFTNNQFDRITLLGATVPDATLNNFYWTLVGSL